MKHNSLQQSVLLSCIQVQNIFLIYGLALLITVVQLTESKSVAHIKSHVPCHLIFKMHFIYCQFLIWHPIACLGDACNMNRFVHSQLFLGIAYNAGFQTLPLTSIYKRRNEKFPVQYGGVSFIPLFAWGLILH